MTDLNGVWMRCKSCDVNWLGKSPCWVCGVAGCYGPPPRPQTYALLAEIDYIHNRWSNSTNQRL